MKPDIDVSKDGNYKSPEVRLMESIAPEIRPAEQGPEEMQRREIERVKAFVAECIDIGEEFRAKFKPDWDEVTKQLRMVPPENWSKKEDWQSKVYIGLQAKTSETVFANLNAMLFPTDRFFEVAGIEKRDREIETAIEDLIGVVLNRGGFFDNKDFMLQEGGDIGTAFLKYMARKDKTGVDFVWRSPYNCVFDPSGRHDWKKCRYWIDQYPKDISWIVDEINKGEGSLYKTEYLQEALRSIEAMTPTFKEEDIDTVRNIDGTSNLRIPKGYRDIMVNEFWGLLPMPKDPLDTAKGYTLQWKLITMINREFIIRIDDNAYGKIPVIPFRIKPRLYDFYGMGYLLNGRGTQDLMNSMVNLGFDSLKICSFDIIIIDENAIADESSIQYKPVAVWKVKGDPRAAVMMTRQQALSAMNDILNGVSLLDRMHQDVTGVTRHSEGSPTIDGKQGESTLGEYQLKLQAVDRRFLSVAKRAEQEFVKSLIAEVYSVLINPELFVQEACTRLIGTTPIMAPEMTIDPMTGQEVPTGQQVQIAERPRLMLETLQQGEFALDFKASGVSQFSERQKLLDRLEKALQAALSNPTLMAMTNIDILWKRIFRVAEIPDWEEIVKSPEQMKNLMSFVQSLQGGVPGDGTPLDQIPTPSGIPTRSAA